MVSRAKKGKVFITHIKKVVSQLLLHDIYLKFRLKDYYWLLI